MTDPPALLTTREVASLFRCHVRTIQGWAQVGTLPSIRIGNGRLLRFPRDQILSLCDDLQRDED